MEKQDNDLKYQVYDDRNILIKSLKESFLQSGNEGKNKVAYTTLEDFELFHSPDNPFWWHWVYPDSGSVEWRP
jgi:hypothetical protein